jgi:hypothetical protein
MKPYKLRKAPRRELYWVVGADGRKHSKEPIILKNAQAQLRLLNNLQGGSKEGDYEDELAAAFAGMSHGPSATREESGRHAAEVTRVMARPQARAPSPTLEQKRAIAEHNKEMAARKQILDEIRREYPDKSDAFIKKLYEATLVKRAHGGSNLKGAGNWKNKINKIRADGLEKLEAMLTLYEFTDTDTIWMKLIREYNAALDTFNPKIDEVTRRNKANPAYRAAKAAAKGVAITATLPVSALQFITNNKTEAKTIYYYDAEKKDIYYEAFLFIKDFLRKAETEIHNRVRKRLVRLPPIRLQYIVDRSPDLGEPDEDGYYFDSMNTPLKEGDLMIDFNDNYINGIYFALNEDGEKLLTYYYNQKGEFVDPVTNEPIIENSVAYYTFKSPYRPPPPAQLAPTGGRKLTYRLKFLKKYNLEDKGYSLAKLAKISGERLATLKEVAKRGLGAYSTQSSSVRMKGSFKKGVDAPMSMKLSPQQWSMSRVYSYLMKNPSHDNDLRG